MQFNERVLKIIDTFEGGSKSQFAKTTGLKSQAYNLLKPSYNPRKITIERLLSAYPQVSRQWLASDIGDMKTANTGSQKEEMTDKFSLMGLPDQLTSHQVLSHILKYSGIESLAKLSVKLNIKLSDLNQVYTGEKTMGGKLAQIIHKAFPEIPYHWIKTGENSSGKPHTKKKESQDTIIPVIPVNDPAPVKKIEPINNKPDAQALELQLQTIQKINEGLLLDYQKVIEVNHRLNNLVIELSEKVIRFSSETMK